MNLTHNGVEIPVRISRSGRAVRCSMRVSERGVEIKAPVFQTEHHIRSFVDKHRKWIARNYAKFKKLEESLPSLRDGELIPFKGERWRVEASESETTGFVDGAFKYAGGFDRDEVLSALLDAYVAAAVDELRSLKTKWSSFVGLTDISFRLKEMGSRWGSCSSTGSISMNWRLIMARPEVFEYVFVHELSHLRRKGHDRRFWREVNTLLPDAPCLRAELKRDNHLLMSFPFKPGPPKTLATL